MRTYPRQKFYFIKNDPPINLPLLCGSGYVTLGAPLAEDGTQMAKAGFKGKLARVNMWSRMLDIRTEIPKQVRGTGIARVVLSDLMASLTCFNSGWNVYTVHTNRLWQFL